MKKIMLTFALGLAACSPAQDTLAKKDKTEKPQIELSGKTDTAVLAGGCFWCVESDFEKLPGVIDAVSGYTGGGTPNPTYRNHGQHIEAVKITFDPDHLSYDDILDHYWKNIDPTDPYGQFCDKGHSYITAIFVRPDQVEQAQKSKAEIEQNKPFSDPIVTEIIPAEIFWDAEGYHQDYYKKNPIRYKYYRNGCGRDKRLQQLWGK